MHALSADTQPSGDAEHGSAQTGRRPSASPGAGAPYAAAGLRIGQCSRTWTRCLRSCAAPGSSAAPARPLRARTRSLTRRSSRQPFLDEHAACARQSFSRASRHTPAYVGNSKASKAGQGTYRASLRPVQGMTKTLRKGHQATTQEQASIVEHRHERRSRCSGCTAPP